MCKHISSNGLIYIIASRCENFYPTHSVAIALLEQFLGKRKSTCRKYKITPCNSANAFGGTILNTNGTNSTTNGSDRGTGLIFY